jgi:hypothetical protein
LLGSSSRLATVFDRAATKSQIDAAVSGDSKAAHNVWLLLVLEIWIEAWGAELN